MKFKETKYGDLTNKIYENDIIILKQDKISSLIGSPKIVKGNFDCSMAILKSLKGSPKMIEKRFNCSQNNLTSLEGSPESVVERFICSYNNLTSLEGSPKIVENYYCTHNRLTSLKGSLKKVIDTFDCKNNPELKNIKKQIIENQIEARFYKTDEGNFTYQSIQKEFEETNKIFKLENLENNKKLQEKIKIIKETDYGLSI